MTPEEINRKIAKEIGLLRDKCENLLAAASLPVPPEIHVQGLTHGLEEIREKLAELYDGKVL